VGLFGTPTPFATDVNPFTGQSAATAAALSTLTNGAVDSDPRTWTPEQAAAQTDRALARIATANPELAQKLQESRTGTPPESEDGGGFFDGLKNVLGEVLDVTGLDTVLELVGRAGKIVPEIVMDWGEESVWKNASDALMGRSDISWDDVLVEKFGMERNFFTAALGFIGDVATDPLTYLTFGAGGVAKAVIGRGVAEASIQSVLKKGALQLGEEAVDTGTFVRKVMEETGAKSLDEVAAVIMQTPEAANLAARGGQSLVAKMRSALGGVAADARPGVAFTVSEAADKAVLTELLRIGDDAFRASTTVGWQRVSRSAAERFGIDKKSVDDILRGRVRAGGITLRNRTAYEQSKAAAAALGGWRVRASIPILGLRLSTNRLPFIPSVVDFSIGRRFFAGLSGNVRLMRMVGNNQASVSDLRAFWEGGFSGPNGLSEFAPEVARKLGRGHLKMGGSIFYPMSEMMGGLTKSLSPSAKVLRGGGLAAKYAADARRQATHIEQQLRDSMRSVQKADGSFYRPDEVDKIIVEPLNKLGDVSDLEQYASLVGQEGFEQGAEAYFQAKIRVAMATNPNDTNTIEALRSQMAKAIDVETRLKTAGALEAAQLWARIGNNGFDELARSGRRADYMEGDPEFLDEIAYEDAASHLANGQLPTQRLRTLGTRGMDDEDLVFTSEAGTAMGLHYRVDGDYTDRIPEDVATDVADRRAQLLRAAEAEPEYAARLLNPYKRDLSEGTKAGGREATETVDLVADLERQGNEFFDTLGDAAGESPELARFRAAHQKAKRKVSSQVGAYTRAKKTGDDAKILAQAEKVNAAKAAADEMEKKLRRYEEVMAEVIEGNPAREAFVGAFVTRELRRRGHDGIVTTKGDVTDVVVFRSAKGGTPVWRLNDRAPRLLTRVNRVPRAATDEAMTAVRRARVKDLPGASEQWLREQIRKTLHLSPDDAEARLRAALREKGAKLREGQRILDRDPVRVINRFVDGAAKEIKDHHLGRYARELENLGYARSPWMGGQVAMEKYQLAGTEAMGKALEKISMEARLAYERVEMFDKRVVQEEMRVAAEAADDALAGAAHELERRVNAAIDLIDQNATWDPTGRVSAAAARGLESPKSTIQKEWASTMRWFRSKQREAGVEHTGKYQNPERLGQFTMKNGRKVTIFRVTLGSDNDRVIYGAIDETIEDAPLVSYRSVDNDGAVSAVTQSGAQKQGLAGELLRHHWDDEGIETIEDAMALIEKNVFSEGGAALNRGAVRNRADFLDRIEDELEDTALRARREFNQAELDTREALREVNRLISRATVKESPSLAAFVPADNALNMTGMSRLDVPGFTDVAMPEFMAQEFKSAMEGFSTASFSAAHKQWRRFNNFWKEAATWLWPGFHIRNFEGAWFNNWLGGVHFSNYVTTGRIRRAAKEITSGGAEGWRWAKMPLKAKDPQLVAALKRKGVFEIGGVSLDDATYADFAVYTGDVGITANNGRAFVEGRMNVEQIEKRKGARPYEKYRATRPIVKGLRGAGSLTENLFRTAAFVHGLEVFGNAMDARAFTMMRQGDYHDLTDFEFKVVRDLVPFYKWMRTNLPFQIHMLLESPGKTLAAIKAGEATWTAMGRDYDEESHKMPKWMRDTMQIPLGPKDDDGFTTMMLDTPLSDLHFNGREFFSSFLPIARPFVESFITEKSTFTGAPLEGAPVKVNPFMAPFVPLMSAVGLAERGADGTGFYISDKTNNLLNIFPVFSRFRNWMSADPERVKQRYSSFASAAFGFSLRPVDQETLTDTELSFYYDQILPTLEWLRGTGYTLPTTDDIEALGSTTDTILGGLGIEPGGAAAMAA
jgi:hypothetical protein